MVLKKRGFSKGSTPHATHGRGYVLHDTSSVSDIYLRKSSGLSFKTRVGTFEIWIHYYLSVTNPAIRQSNACHMHKVSFYSNI